MLNRFYLKFLILFIKVYKKFVKNSFPAKKIERSAKLIRKGNFANYLLASNNLFNFMHVTGKLGRSALEYSFFGIIG